MSRRIRNICQRLALAIFFSLFSGHAARAAGEAACFTDWGAAGEVVRAQRLVTVEDIAARAGERLGGEIIKATLCRQADDYVYRLVVRSEAGRLRSATVGAATGIEIAKRR